MSALTFTPAVKWVLCRARRAAIDGGDEYICLEHLANAIAENRLLHPAVKTLAGRRRKVLPAGIAAEYQAGATMPELAARYAVSLPTIHRNLRELGVPSRPCGHVKGAAHPAVRKLALSDLPALLARFDAGETLQSIGTRYGITRERVRQIAAAHGRPARSAQTLHA